MYTLKEHGDILERTYHSFITEQIPCYENVWKSYIGNIGNDTKALIPNYPQDRDLKRQAFSEHTYTVLQSLILLKELLDLKSFENIVAKDFAQRLILQNNILLYFAHIGRIRDNMIAASKCLLNLDPNIIAAQLEEFYHQRHIPIHGRIMPLVFKENGEVDMPILSKNDEDPSGWNHKVNNWPDILSMPIASVSDVANQIFWTLLPLLNGIFGNFEAVIKNELNGLGVKLTFERINPNGNAGCSGVDVYGIGKTISGWGSASGSYGSSGSAGH